MQVLMTVGDMAETALGGDLAAPLLAWYDRHARRLAWRAQPGQPVDPYRVWLSEVMLQQTTVAAVDAYFHAFTDRWPRVEDLAAAPLDEVLTAWAGLGYYARARNLHRCANEVATRHGGLFPADEDELRRLPGIGEYTAAAIAAIAFQRPAAVMDGNVERVLARLADDPTPLPAAKPRLKTILRRIVPAERPGDFAQAMMDLGATICTPRKPRCVLCPWRPACRAARSGRAEDLPVKAAKAERPIRRAIAFWVTAPSGAILLRRRPERGLLGGMIEVPSSEWRTGTPPDLQDVCKEAPVAADWRLLPGLVRHTFTHFHLELQVAAARASQLSDGLWVLPDALGDHALPSVMRKVVRHAMAQNG